MSDSSSDVFSVTGTSWILVSRETYTQIMLREFGQNLGGRTIEFAIAKEPIKTSIANSVFETWQNGDLISRIIWERPGQLHEVLRSHWPSWKTSKLDIAEEDSSKGKESPQPSQEFPAGGTGPRLNSKQLANLRLHLADAATSSVDPETIRLYAKLLRSCLKAQQQIG